MVKTHTLRDLFERYETEVSSKKRGAASEHYRLTTLKASQIARLRLDNPRPTTDFKITAEASGALLDLRVRRG
jgi:hypothetical protein